MAAYSNLSSPIVESISKVSDPSDRMAEIANVAEALQPSVPAIELSKTEIRSSLKASTWDGIFAALFCNITGGVLLSNFLLQIGASTVEIGILTSAPMLVNLLQPVGAYLSNRSNSRRNYNLWIFSPSRLVWLILAIGIWFVSNSDADKHALLLWTLAIVLATNLLTALGSASWLSWMATLVPQRLRGRYFGLRNSAAGLTNLISVPLLGFAVSSWPGGSIQGYAVLLLLGVVFGSISLACQLFMADVNPHAQGGKASSSTGGETPLLTNSVSLPDPVPNNFWRFLLYFGLWTFAANISSPFFNLYLLDDMAFDVTWVTLYNSLSAGANLLMLMVWGKLADRIGNRPILLLVGMLVAVTPLLWLGIGNNAVSFWVLLPLIHLLTGSTWSAIDLCSNNMLMGVASSRDRATYFGIAAAIGGVSGALATTTSSFMAEFANIGGLPGLFVISSVLRSIALLPLIFVREERSQSIGQIWQSVLRGARG